MNVRQRPAVVACLGGGGAYGIGLHFGVADALREFGLPLTQAPVVGTSAGAWAGAALALGVDLGQVMEPWSRTLERRFGHRSIDTVRAVFPEGSAPQLFGVAARLPGRRVLLPAAKYGVLDVVAAAASPPPFAVPHAIEGRRYIDAGLLSICSVDLAPAADLLVVVAPIAGQHMGAAGRFSDSQTRRHIRQWKRRHGGHVLYLSPDRELAATAGRGVRNLFEPERAGPARAAGRSLAARRLADFARENPAAPDLLRRKHPSDPEA
jgi:predicted acylesterase/phospholipase RssA